MRIIAGKYKGKTVDAPEGDNTRPTIDRVRESLFSTLYSSLGGFEEEYVLDAFAGSGALGIEALSRGARYAVFCEHDAKTAETIQRNLRNVGADVSTSRVCKIDVTTTRPYAPHPFSLVFLDPPYAMSEQAVMDLLDGLLADGLLADNVLVAYEHAASTNISNALEPARAGWVSYDSRRYGKVAVDFLERGAQ